MKENRDAKLLNLKRKISNQSDREKELEAELGRTKQALKEALANIEKLDRESKKPKF